jgi:hypothetical protein
MQHAELVGVELVQVLIVEHGRDISTFEAYIHADGTRIRSLMQLERQLQPEAYGRRRGGYLDRRRTRQ